MKTAFNQRQLEVYRNHTAEPVRLKVAPGLRLLVTPANRKTWSIRYSIAGKPAERTIGQFGDQDGEITLTAALAELMAVKVAAKSKEDLIEIQRREDEIDRLSTAGDTLGALYADWFAQAIAVKRGRKGRKNGGTQVECVWRLHLKPHFGALRISALTRTKVARALSDLSKNGKTPTALIAFGLLMQMLRWADKRNPYRRMLIDSDVLGMEAEDVIVGDYDAQDREGSRVLDDAELRELAARLRRSTMPV